MDNYGNGKKPGFAVKNCERCGNAFECNAADIENCDCYSIRLKDTEMEKISTIYKDCLCMKCLRELSKKQSS